MSKQRTQKPRASWHSGHTGKAYKVAQLGQELGHQALPALLPSGFSETYYVLGTVPGSSGRGDKTGSHCGIKWGVSYWPRRAPGSGSQRRETKQRYQS